MRVEIDVDVGRDLPLVGQKALEHQVLGDGIDGADAQQIGHQRVGGRSAPLAANSLLSGEADDVPDDQEIVGQLRLFDDFQFVPELLPDAGRRAGIALGQGFFAQTPQIGLGAHAVRRGEGGQVLQAVAQLEPAAFGKNQRVGQSLRMVGKEFGHLPGRLQIILGVGAPEMGGGVQRRQMADANQHILQPVPVREVVVDVIGDHAAQLQMFRQGGQAAGEPVIVGQAVALQFDPEVVAAEQPAVVAGGGHGRFVSTLADQGRGDFSPAAAGQGDQARRAAGQFRDGQYGPAFGRFRPGPADEVAQVVPAGLVFHEQRQVVDVVRAVAAIDTMRQREFRAQDGLYALFQGCANEAGRGVDGVVVGQGQRAHAQFGRAGDQFLRVARPVQQAMARVTMQLDVVRRAAA